MSDPSQLHGDWALKSRAEYGIIESVSPALGIVHVRTATSPIAVPVPIPFFGMSPNGARTAGGRFVPIRGAHVRLAWDVHDDPYIDSYVIPKGIGDGPAHRWAGGADLARLAADNVQGYRIWGDLQEGEWELRSYGSAVLYLTRGGRASLSAGPTSLDLAKSSGDARLRALLTVLGGDGGDGCELRIGSVYRQIPPALAEGALPLPLVNPTAPAAKEFRVQVGRPAQLVPPGPPVSLFELWAGDLRSPLGTPEPGPFGVPLRARTRYFQADGLLDALSVQVDALGQVQVTQAPAAPLGVVARPTRFDVQAQGALPSVLGVAQPVGGLLLGGPAAVQSVPQGELLVAQVQALTAQVSALCSLLSANIGAVASIPGGGAAVITGALPSIVSALAQVTAALSVPAGPGSVLSGKVKVDT